MFTDIHTHAFHPKIAAKAIEHLNEHYKVCCAGTGTIEDLKTRAAGAGIDRFVVLCAATAAAQVIPANNYAIALQEAHEEVIAFGTLHPDDVHWQKQLARLRQYGIKGIKLHPDFQHFWLDDPRLLPIFEEAQHDFFFEIHIGDTISPAKNPSCPYKVAHLLDTFPHLRIIAAHLGGYRQWDHALKTLVGRDIWLDTSSTTPFLPPNMLKEILRKHPHERILFGSDYPLYDPCEEMQRLQKNAALSDTTLEQFLSNADTLFPSQKAL